MPSRRHIVLGGLALGTTVPLLTACSSDASSEEAARNLRRPIIVSHGDRAGLLRELVRYATLAPSSHNTQCWTFRVQEHSVRIEPDLSRRCPAVDPDDHHLFVSLGCATENFAQAALSNGLAATAQFDPTDAGAVAVNLETTQALSSPLFQAIPTRQCSRSDYDGKALATEELQLLERAGNGNGVRVLLLTDHQAREKVLECVLAGDTAQLNSPVFIAELKSWIRFSAAEAARTGDGLYSGSTGNLQMPRWLGSRLMRFVLSPKSENDRYARQMRSSAGIAVFASDADDRTHWVEAGRSYERFALQATLLGIRTAFLNQAVEVGAVRLQLASALGLGNLRPDLVVRFGRGPTMPYSLRRPVQAVLV